MIKLGSAPKNTPFIIDDILNGELKARMYDVGLYPNQTIKVIRKAPFGNPLVVQLDGQLIMLRTEEADQITVREVE